MSKKPSMLEWLEKKLVDESPEHKCQKIALVHSGTQKEIPPTFKFAGKQFKASDLETMFRNRAENFSEGTDGSQRFELLAFYEGSNDAEDQFIFMSHKSQTDLGKFDEGPDDKGIKQQSMRHLEAAMRMALNQTQQLFEQTSNQMRIQANTIEKLTEENREAFGIVKEMIMEKVNAQTEQRLKLMEYERETAERKQWLKFAPPLINSIFGREIFPQSLEDTALIEAVAEKLSGEQIERLASSGLFPAELWGPLANRMNKYMKEKQEEQEMVKRLAETASKDAEADAGGDVIGSTPKQIAEGEIVN